jgi:hypothetical protein
VQAHSAATAGLIQIAHEANASMPRRYSRAVADLDERLEAAEDALLDLAADYLASGNDPSRRPSEDEMYRVWIHVRHTLEVLAALHGQTPKEMAVQALEYAPTSEEWASRYASWVKAAREELEEGGE